MKKFLVVFTVMLLALPFTAFADEGPLPLPAGAKADAVKHNDEGIEHFKAGHYDVALKHFEASAKEESKWGAVHFNEALALDKMGKHEDATKHFKKAQEMAGGDKAILESATLMKHVK